MQVTETDESIAVQSRSSLGKRVAILICMIASAVGWAAILGLILLLEPELPF